MISINNIFYQTDTKIILDKISLEINQGDFICLYGQNGAGKSILALILAGIIKPTAGEIKLNNKILDNANKIETLKSKIGIVFQNVANQFIYNYVARELAFSLENQNLDYEKMETKVKDVANIYEIEHLLDKKVKNLSGGEQQKVAIASFETLAKDIIIFDESFSMLDPASKAIMHQTFNQLKTLGKTIIFITHDLLDLPQGYDWKYWFLQQKKLKEFANESEFLLNNHQFFQNPLISQIVTFQKHHNLKITLNHKTIGAQIDEHWN